MANGDFRPALTSLSFLSAVLVYSDKRQKRIFLLLSGTNAVVKREVISLLFYKKDIQLYLMLLVFLSIVSFSSCGPAGDESFVVGIIIELDSERIVIEPIPSSQELHIPYNSRLEGIDRIAFSKDFLEEDTFSIGDTVIVTYINDIQQGNPYWINAVSWSAFHT